jgi:TRAP-type C4-dicarboxylate transport system substrate-binding protein
MKTLSLPVLTTTLFLSGCNSEGPDRLQLNLANPHTPNSITALSDTHFAELLNTRVGEQLTVTNHFGGALGYESRDHFEAVETGALRIASSNLDKLVGFAPIFQLQSLPFLAPDIQESLTLYQTARPYYETAFRDVGQTLLYASPWTPIGIWAKRRLEDPSDLSGLKIRTFDINGTQTMEAAGAIPVQLPWGDVIPALSTNMIEAVLTSNESGVAARFWEHMHYFHELGYTVGLSIVHMNRQTLDDLPADLQSMIYRTAAEVEADAWTRAEKKTATNNSILKEHGVSIVTNTKYISDHLIQAGLPMLNEWKTAMGEKTAISILADYNTRLSTENFDKSR